jgi:predicted  nucleic acid-binding Zn-ribbon protein
MKLESRIDDLTKLEEDTGSLGSGDSELESTLDDLTKEVDTLRDRNATLEEETGPGRSPISELESGFSKIWRSNI